MSIAMIAGGSGLVGGACLAGLLRQEQFSQVISLGRRPLKVKHPKLRSLVVNFESFFTPLSLDLPQAATAFCCLGTTLKAAGSKAAFRRVDAEYVHAFAQLAFKQGCQNFLLVSAMGAERRSRFFYSRIKGEAEELVQNVGFTSTYIMRPSLLIGSRQEHRPLEDLAQKASHLLALPLRGPLAKYRPIAAQTVAAAMLKAALQPQPGVHILNSAEIASF